MKTLFAALSLTIAIAFPVIAQDRDGNDTPGEWIVTHQKAFGLWDSFCDERTTGDLLEERCYVRYVDVFSKRPNFGAMFFFLTPGEIEFGLERGMEFEPDGFRVERDGEVVWQETRRPCLAGRECKLTAQDAADFEALLEKGGEMQFTFTDPDGNPRDLTWNIDRMDETLADFRAQAVARGLL